MRLRIKSDGTFPNTTVETEDGERLDFVESIAFHLSQDHPVATVTLKIADVELALEQDVLLVGRTEPGPLFEGFFRCDTCGGVFPPGCHASCEPERSAEVVEQDLCRRCYRESRTE